MMSSILTTLDNKNYTILNNDDFLKLVKTHLGDECHNYLQNILDEHDDDYDAIVSERDVFEFLLGDSEDQVYLLENELDDTKSDVKNLKNQIAEYENTGLTPVEVAELAQAKEDGLVVKLPLPLSGCAFGIKTQLDKDGKEFETVEYIDLDRGFDGLEKWPMGEIVISVDGWEIGYSDIGKTVFLTEAEAQAALDKMEEQE